jgi:hypothetical protein
MISCFEAYSSMREGATAERRGGTRIFFSGDANFRLQLAPTFLEGADMSETTASAGASRRDRRVTTAPPHHGYH